MRLPRRLHLVTYGMPVLSAAVFLAGVQGPQFVPDAWRRSVLWICFATLLICVAAASFVLASRVAERLVALRMTLVPVMLAAATFAVFLYVDRNISRILVAALAVGLLGAHAAFVAGLHAPQRYKLEDLKHINFVMRIVASFCALAYAFALPTISRIPSYVVPFLVALWVGIMAWESFHDESFVHRPPRLFAAAFALLGAEFYAGFALLPLTPYVNASVALALLVTGLSTTVLALRGAAPPRRNFVVAAVVIITVLVTARWY